MLLMQAAAVDAGAEVHQAPFARADCPLAFAVQGCHRRCVARIQFAGNVQSYVDCLAWTVRTFNGRSTDFDLLPISSRLILMGAGHSYPSSAI